MTEEHYDCDDLQEVPVEEVVKEIIHWAGRMYFYQDSTPPNWHPNVINAMVELYMDMIQFNHCLQHQPKVNEILIETAIINQWTIRKLVWVAIATHYHAIPIFYGVCQQAADDSSQGTYQ